MATEFSIVEKEVKGVPQPNFEDNANILSGWFVTYLDPLFEKGSKQTLELTDLGQCADQDKCDRLYTEFEKNWKYEVENYPIEKRSIWRPLWATVGWSRLFLSMTLYLGYNATGFGPIMILNQLVEHFDHQITLSTPILWFYVCLMFILPVFGSILAAQSNVVLAHVGLAFRNILINKIYRKSLVLSPSARQESSTGQIVNMFSADTAQIQRFMFFLNNVFLAPITIGVCLYLIYTFVGLATFAGLGLIIIVMPLNGVIFNKLGQIRKKKALESDQRVKLMNEILNGIRVIKYYAWELPFIQKINEIRLRELTHLKHLAYISSVAFSLILMAIPIFLPVLIFFVYVRLGNNLTSAKAFTTIALFNFMQFPFVFLPLGLQQYSQCLVASKRMMNFFIIGELDGYVKTTQEDDIAVKLENACLSWHIETEEKTEDKGEVDVGAEGGEKGKTGGAYETITTDNTDGIELTDVYETANETVDSVPINRSVHTLIDLNLTIKKGSLVAIIGPVGSGKSSFLNALLGEMNKNSGDIGVSGSIAYCDQRPWILNETVADNILFGKKFDEEKFDGAIFSSALDDDLNILPGGIQTEIGEKGINLSGGQKARVALARAVYTDADIYLLDDPLSAVDAHVGQFLFHECVKHTLKDKTRILVTHQVHLLPYMDQIVILKDGRISFSGTHDEMVAQGVDLETLLPVIEAEAQEEPSALLAPIAPSSDAPMPTMQSSTSLSMQRMNFAPSPIVTDESNPADSSAMEPLDVEQSVEEMKEGLMGGAAAAPAPIVTGKGLNASDEDWWKQTRGGYVEKSALSKKSRKEDERKTMITSVEEVVEGDVPLEAYTYYVKVGGYGLAAGLFLGMLLSQTFQVGSLFYLQYWGQKSGQREEDGDPFSNQENIGFLQIFAALASCSLLFYIARSLFLAEHRIGTSSALHSGLLEGTCSAPIAFFDVTPVGRILNRFSADLVVIDEELSQTISQITNSAMSIIGALAAIAASTKGLFLIIVVPLIWIYNRIQKFFRSTNTAIARLESVSRSPIYAGFSQALSGVNSIRAYGVQESFIKSLVVQVDKNSNANMTMTLSSQWLAIRLDMIGAFISFFVAGVAASLSGSDSAVSAGFLAIGLTYSLQVTQLLKFLVRMIASGEAQMNAVERLRHFENNLVREGLKDKELPADQIPDSWPSKGVVQGIDIEMKYRAGPLVLKGISFDVNSCDKVGIVGRTGSGKSSLISALFRIQEIQPGGKIVIDELDISTVPLHLLRSRLGIIPQESVMFSFTVRFNLDPTNQFTDVQLWNVLEELNLKEHISSLKNKLEEQVSEGGDNFSAGQRQLICIARAILRKPKVLVLDEATASIDNETDNIVQRVIRDQFADCTVLTIAHRLNTIIDSTSVMTLEDGYLKEYDAPDKLLSIENGLFKSLWSKHQNAHQATSSSNDLTTLDV